MAVNEYLGSMKTLHPQFSEYWSAYQEYYNKKLWHQLTKKIEAFVKLPESSSTDLVTFYKKFIADFESKLNPLALIEIISYIIKEMKNTDETIEFLKNMKMKVKINQNASLLCSILMAQLKLAQKDLDGSNCVFFKIYYLTTFPLTFLFRSEANIKRNWPDYR